MSFVEGDRDWRGTPDVDRLLSGLIQTLAEVAELTPDELELAKTVILQK